MRVQDILLAMRRRWYLAVATIVLAVAATLLTVSLVGPTYQAKGAVLLVPPGTTLEQRPGAATAGNPYLELGGLNQARDIVIRSMSAKATYIELCETAGDARYESMRRDLCSARPSVAFEISQDYESSAPVIMVTAEAGSPADAITALKTVMARVPATLQELQGGLNLRPKAAITSTPIVADTLPDVVHKDQIRAAVLAGGGVLALGILLTGMVDGLFLPRRQAGSDELDPDDTGEASEVDGAEQAPTEVADDTTEATAPRGPVVRRPRRLPTRPARPAKQPPAVPDWGAPTEPELAGAGADRSARHWD